MPATVVDSVIEMSYDSASGPQIPGLAGLSKLTFASGLPGFPEVRDFELSVLAEDFLPFARLQSTDQPGVGFTVVAPGLLYPDYSIEIDDEDQEALGVRSSDDVVTMVMVTVPRPPATPSANLLGPIVVNRFTGAAAQVVQYRSSYRVAEALPV